VRRDPGLWRFEQIVKNDMLKIHEGLLKRLLIRIGMTGGMVAAAFLLRVVLTAYAGPGLPTYVTFYPAVMLVAMIGGVWFGLLGAAMVAFLAAYWILPPRGQFAIENLSDAVGLVLFSSMGVFLSVVAEGYRRTRQRINEKNVELAKANEALRQLSSKLLSAQEDERKRIAGEIHDTLGSCLAAIKFKAENDRRQICKTGNGLTSECLNALIPMLQECAEECKRIQMDLRPPMLDDLGLLAALSWFWARFRKVYSNIQIEQEIEVGEDDVPPSLRIVIFRVTQEAMNNIVKHSKAGLVRYRLWKRDGRMELALQDNGQGFDLKEGLDSESTKWGLGLTSMRERTELSGGSFEIASGMGKGTVIQASWPVS
jgi:signal transduction histidine kinase